MNTERKLMLAVLLTASLMLISAQESFAAKASKININTKGYGSICGYTGEYNIKGSVISTAHNSKDGKTVVHGTQHFSYWDSSGQLLGNLNFVSQQVINPDDLPSTINFNWVVTCAGNGHAHNLHFGWTVGKSGLVESVHCVNLTC